MKKSFSYPIIFMVLITAFFTLVLSLLNYSTKDVIAYNAQIEEWKTLLYIFDIDYQEDDKEIENLYKEKIEAEKVNDITIYKAKENGDTLGYAFPVEGNALWGTVRGYAAVSNDLNTLLGIDFVSHSETPGLGGRISEEWFKEQFRGIDLTENNEGDYIEYRPAASGNVDAITGATLTSKSVKNMLNKDIEEFRQLMKEGLNNGQ
ncbi:FMN-binding protein [Clostridium sp. D2Q-11]|uniref:Ion-translocating oxidoreductase complex subunit G n=1 Tax=Anaeromonas frigoriresistens TaxID=2683708 RepID=A0A942UUF5_9FIRM|nr:FMN-binding protein [Anaeromonas frigoriresistens]MBS4537670.1 FMN-binding protein [Anaeromonas frigoriresistens]